MLGFASTFRLNATVPSYESRGPARAACSAACASSAGLGASTLVAALARATWTIVAICMAWNFLGTTPIAPR